VLVRPGSVDLPLPHPAPATASQFSADGTRLATFAGNAVRVWDTSSGEPVGPPLEVDGPGNLIPRLELADDGGRVAGIFSQQERSAAAIVWEARGRRLFTLPNKIESGLQIFGESNLDGVVASARLSPDGRLIAVAVDSSGELSVFETDAGLRRFRARVYRGYVYQMEFDSAGHSLFAAASDTQARELDTATGKLVSPTLHHPALPRQMGISPDGRHMATISEDGRLRVWDVRAGDLLLNANVQPNLDDFSLITRGQRRCWFNHDGKTVQFFSKPNYVRLHLPSYAGPADAVARAARLLTGRYLDETNGLADLASDELIENREAYRKAWLAWQGLPDDPEAQP
jgi:WD40 repeat protein